VRPRPATSATYADSPGRTRASLVTYYRFGGLSWAEGPVESRVAWRSFPPGKLRSASTRREFAVESPERFEFFAVITGARL